MRLAVGLWEEQQRGQDRAKYGAHEIDRLSDALTHEFGCGYSRESLRNAIRFYPTFQERPFSAFLSTLSVLLNACTKPLLLAL